MDEKRLSEIEVILDECETTNELRRVMGSTGPLRELVAEIRRLREALAFYGDKKNHCLRFGRDAEHFFKGSEVAYDMGKRARVALGAAPAPETEE